MRLISESEKNTLLFENWQQENKNKLRSYQIHENYVDLQPGTGLNLSSLHSDKLDVSLSKIHPYASNNIPLKGKLLILRFQFDWNYGHVLHDLLPLIALLDESSTAEKIAVLATPMLKSLIKAHRTRFNKVLLFEPKQIKTFIASAYFIYDFDLMTERNTKMSANYKKILDSNINSFYRPPTQNLLIYCSRNSSSDVHHNRIMKTSTENKIIKTLKAFALKNGLEFLVFNGQENGKTMSHEKQIRLFRKAKVAIGPHGSAMANIIYMDPRNSPVVCEFCSGPDNIVHGKGPFKKNYNFLNSFAIDKAYIYFIILFDDLSSSAITSIRMPDFRKFLRELKAFLRD